MGDDGLLAALCAQVPAPAASWLREGLSAISAAQEKAADELAVRWSGAGRRLGKAPVELTALEADQAQPRSPLDGGFIPRGWGADELGRVLLLRAALAALPAETHARVVEDLYRRGETRERQAVLRALPHLPAPQRFIALAVDSVRANVLTEIEAIACDNPFPSRHFSEEAFNQMVLKCLFTGLPLARVEGLPARRTAELARMVAGFASERRAAGREVPADVALILDPQQQGGPDASL